MRSEKRIHVLSNEVTLTDVVNTILAVGGTAICGNDPLEVEEITEICDGLVLNIGMPKEEKLTSMLLAGKRANQNGIPVLLDPVGVGATSFRKKIVDDLLTKISFQCMKGNDSEIAYLCGKKVPAYGVESGEVTLLFEEMRELSINTGAVIIATGERNRIVSEKEEEIIEGGSVLLKKITGSGCMLSGVLATFLAREEKKNHFKVLKEGLLFFNACAKTAEELVRKRGEGLGSFKRYFMDELSRDRDLRR